MMPAKPCCAVVWRSTDVLVSQAARLEQLAHLHRHQVDVAERLLEQRLGAFPLRLRPLGRIARPVGGHHRDDDIGCRLANRGQQRHPVQLWHPDVGEHHVDVLARHEIARHDAVLGGEHFEPVALEQQPHPFAHRLLVVGDQDARLLGRRFPDRLRDSRLPAPGFFMTPGAPLAGSADIGNVTRKMVPRPGRGVTSMWPS